MGTGGPLLPPWPYTALGSCAFCLHSQRSKYLPPFAQTTLQRIHCRDQFPSGLSVVVFILRVSGVGTVPWHKVTFLLSGLFAGSGDGNAESNKRIIINQYVCSRYVPLTRTDTQTKQKRSCLGPAHAPAVFLLICTYVPWASPLPFSASSVTLASTAGFVLS